MSGPDERLPLGYLRLIQCARALVDGLRYDPVTDMFVIATDLVARRDDLDVMTTLAEREIAATREATGT